MNCWWVNHYACPSDEPGGTRHHAMARGLGQRGIDVTLIASSFHYTKLQERLDPGEQVRVETRDGVRYAWLRTRAYSEHPLARLRNMRSFAKHLSSASESLPVPRPDVIIGSSPHLYAADAARRVAQRFGIPFCSEIRDIWPESLVDIGGASRLNPVIMHMGRIERRLYRASSKIFTLLPGSEKHICSRGGNVDSVQWIPNGIDPSLVPPASAPPQDSPFTLVYAGAHGIANDLDTLLDAGRMLQEDSGSGACRIVLIGDGPRKKHLQDRARAESIDLVEFRDPVAKRDIYPILQSANACLLPLKPGGVFRHGISPNKMFDYMAAGRPVITMVDTPVNPVVDAGAGVSIPSGDPAALASAIRDMAGLPEEDRVAMGDRGRAMVMDQFNLDELAERVAGALRGVVES
ncbi:MAG: glycosyltransferase WbuB [Phycisphaerae bacterium]|nr:glycosyltransferase WbuB [Phycisphaerae bacterium]